MFSNVPSLIESLYSQNEWSVQLGPSEGVDDLILDTHFNGLTPLNDPETLENSFKYGYILIQSP